MSSIALILFAPEIIMKCSCAHAQSLGCVQLWDPMECSPPGSSVHGTLQARILEWVAVSSSRGSSWPRGQINVPYISCNGRWVFYLCAILVNRCSQMGTGVYVTRPTSGSLLTFRYKRPKNQPLCWLHFRLGAVAPGMCNPGFAWLSFLAEEGNGNPLQYYCLENPMGRGAWQATVHGVTKS